MIAMTIYGRMIAVGMITSYEYHLPVYFASAYCLLFWTDFIVAVASMMRDDQQNPDRNIRLCARLYRAATADLSQLAFGIYWYYCRRLSVLVRVPGTYQVLLNEYQPRVYVRTACSTPATGGH